jgi:hypothetical protein
MVLKFAKELGFETQEEYFEYILESRTNGNLKQSRELYHNLLNVGLRSENADFWNWLGESFCSEMTHEETREFFREWRKFFNIR